MVAKVQVDSVWKACPAAGGAVSRITTTTTATKTLVFFCMTNNNDTTRTTTGDVYGVLGIGSMSAKRAVVLRRHVRVRVNHRTCESLLFFLKKRVCPQISNSVCRLGKCLCNRGYIGANCDTVRQSTAALVVFFSARVVWPLRAHLVSSGGR